MADDKAEKGKLPGNHGQFGEANATEEYKPLQDQHTAAPPTVDDAQPAGAGQGA